jgi:hypothetical protein
MALSVTVPVLALIASMLVTPALCSEIQNGPVGPYDTLHGLIRIGSVSSAGTNPSEIRLI